MSSSSTLSLDHLPPSQQLCYVHCNVCDTVLAEEISNTIPNFLVNQAEITLPTHGVANELPRPPVINRPPEKRLRVPSAYNRFIKDEIQRIKAGNPDITHREAFSAAAKNWAHFPHFRFGLKPDQPAKKANVHQQDGEEKSELRRTCW